MPELIGAYERIVLFLEECKKTDVIDAGKQKRLLDAVEEVSGGGKPIEIKWQNAEGAKEGMQLLNACGIETAKSEKDARRASDGKAGGKISRIMGNKGQNIFQVKASKIAAGISGRSEDEDRIAAETVQFWWSAHKQKKMFKLALAAESCLFERSKSFDLRLILSDTNFDCYKPANMERSLIQQLIHYGFTRPWNLILRYEINSQALRFWADDISKKYLECPYHNWYHAFDVFQFCHVSANSGLVDFLNFQDVFSLLIAAIAHDVAHPGYTNPYLIATKAPLAIVYNDRSPLENMHAATCFQTMVTPGKNNFLSTLEDAERANIRTKIVTAILATDNKHHFEMVDKFKTRMAKVDSSPFTKGSHSDPEKQKTSKDDRRLLLQAFMHMSDVANCCRPFDVYKRVVGYLEAEFFNQGDSERSLGMPCSMLMDNTKDSLAAAQGFWINNMVGPLFTPWSNFLNEDTRETMKGNMEHNTKGWEQLLQKHGKKTAGELLKLEGLEGFK